jgi:hypothetical protein
MDSDNIIYIIIAVVLAIVNAVAQKKKKTEAAKRIITIDEEDDHLEGFETEPVIQRRTYSNEAEPNPFEILFGKEQVVDEIVPPTMQVDELKFDDEGKSAIETEKLSSYQLLMQQRAQELVDSDWGYNSFNFDEDSIDKSAISDALTHEEEELAVSENRSEFVKNFDLKSAILYSEVIKPKYFSIGVIG